MVIQNIQQMISQSYFASKANNSDQNTPQKLNNFKTRDIPNTQSPELYFNTCEYS